MIRKLKVLGLALVAVFALSAVASSVASAQNGILTSDGPVTGIGTELTEVGDENTFKAFGQTLTCPGAIYTIHKYNVTPHTFVPKTGESTFTVTPHYEPETKTEKNCHIASGFFITVTMNSCDFVFHLGTTKAANVYNFTADVVCPAGKVVEVHAYTDKTEEVAVCTYTIGPQSGLSGPTVTDEGTGTIRVTGTFTGVKVNRDAGLCGAAKEEKTATYSIATKIKGLNEAGGATGISLSHL